jgi:hypothetical protein
MFYGSDNHDLLWNMVSGDHERVQKQASLAHAKVAVAQYWPFLSRATSQDDFENRLSLTLDRIAARVPAETFEDVVNSLRDDFRALAGNKNVWGDDKDDVDGEEFCKECEHPIPGHYTNCPLHRSNIPGKKKESAKGENPFAKDDDSDDDEADDDDKDSKSNNNSDDDSDNNDSDDDKKSDDDDDSDDDSDDDKSKDDSDSDDSEGLSDKDHQKPDFLRDKKTATNYQPDPNAAWRYHPGYEQLRAPVDNGALQDSDGFPQDLAAGEYAGAEQKWQLQLTPGTWTQHDGMPERPMPFSQQRGYMPVNASLQFDAQGFVIEKTANQYIKQQGGKWVILQKGTGKVLSHHDSQEEAEASFRAMEMHKHQGALHFDAQGFVVQADNGRGVDALQDPVPGQPQRHNPFYFQEGSNMGSNAGFPTDPSKEPLFNNMDEIYGEQPPVSSSGSAEGQVDGDGYSRLNSTSALHYDAEGYLVEPRIFTRTAADYVNTPEPPKGSKTAYHDPDFGGFPYRQASLGSPNFT